ncbi:hypothetical protein [Microbulbifer marinus]|uniref:hypothetical protein n=1 Tax=Microbulbifer marinus TaxID=658218 RepID=UPI00147A7146|nr:hypothetical protein [Microbulbifer marinus]
MARLLQWSVWLFFAPLWRMGSKPFDYRPAASVDQFCAWVLEMINKKQPSVAFFIWSFGEHLAIDREAELRSFAHTAGRPALAAEAQRVRTSGVPGIDH